MKQDDFLDAVSEIDSDIVEQFLKMDNRLAQKNAHKAVVNRQAGEGAGNRPRAFRALLPVAAVLLMLSVLTVSLLLPMNKETPPPPPVGETETTIEDETTSVVPGDITTEEPSNPPSFLMPSSMLTYWGGFANPVIVEWGEITEKRIKPKDFKSVIQIDDEYSYEDFHYVDITYIGVEIKTMQPFISPLKGNDFDWETVLEADYFLIPEPYLDEIKQGSRALLFVDLRCFDEQQEEVYVYAEGYSIYGELFLTHRLCHITEDERILIPGFGQGIYGEKTYVIPQKNEVLKTTLYDLWDCIFIETNYDCLTYFRDGMTVRDFQRNMLWTFQEVKKTEESWEELWEKWYPKDSD